LTDDKRESERLPMPGKLRGEVTVFQPMTILDISAGGAQVETAFPLHLDSLHDFRLSLDDRTVVVKGRIVRCQIGNLLEGSVQYRTGIEFVEPSEHAVAAILAFVEVHRTARQATPIVIDAELADEGM
jgi:hypothetical protein